MANFSSVVTDEAKAGTGPSGPGRGGGGGRDKVFVTGVVCAALALGFAGYRFWALGEESRAHDAVIKDASEQVQSFEASSASVSSEPVTDSSAVRDYLAEAREAADGLARAQTGYQDVPREEIGDYAEGTVGAYLGEDMQHRRVPWCNARLNARYTWKASACYDYDSGLVPCVWTAVMDDGTVVDYVVGDYDVSTRKFESLEHYNLNSIKDYMAPADAVVNDERGGTTTSHDSSGSGAAASGADGAPSASAASSGNPASGAGAEPEVVPGSDEAHVDAVDGSGTASSDGVTE